MALNSGANWNAPGLDRIPNFCLKKLKANYEYLAE